MTIEEKMYAEVKHRCELPSNKYGIGAWDHHIKIVYELAKKYASEYGADPEIVAIAALLHDIASVTDARYTEYHHIIGADMATKLLASEGYPADEIKLVERCILNHRGSVLERKTTPEEVCLADSDAMAHFYSVPSLLSMVYREKGMSIDDGRSFVMEKLERSYNKMSDKGKQLVFMQYDAAKMLLACNGWEKTLPNIESINATIRELRSFGISVNGISDIYHTLGDYKDMRNSWFIAALKANLSRSWKSKKHFDEENDPMFNGDFVAGIYTPEGVVAQHLKMKFWEDLADVPTLDRAPAYDGYGKEEAMRRIGSILPKK